MDEDRDKNQDTDAAPPQDNTNRRNKIPQPVDPNAPPPTEEEREDPLTAHEPVADAGQLQGGEVPEPATRKNPNDSERDQGLPTIRGKIQQSEGGEFEK